MHLPDYEWYFVSFKPTHTCEGLRGLVVVPRQPLGGAPLCILGACLCLADSCSRRVGARA